MQTVCACLLFLLCCESEMYRVIGWFEVNKSLIADKKGLCETHQKAFRHSWLGRRSMVLYKFMY